VLKHVHHSVNINDIKIELEGKGHAVRNMMNGRHWRTKKPLNLFFIDLEPAENNTEVFRIQRLLNLAVVIETPKRSKGSARDVNNMDTQKLTATNPLCV